MKHGLKRKFGCWIALLVAWIGGIMPLAAASSMRAPVEVRAISGDRLANEGSSTIELEFKTARSNQALDVVYTVDEGLALESSDKAQLVTQQNGRVIDAVRLRALRPGRLYLNVFITMENKVRVVSIPVQIGPEERLMQHSAVRGRQAVDSKGQSLVILPAQETSR